MNPAAHAWFWLLIISIIGFILTFIFFEVWGGSNTGNANIPMWLWILFIVFFVIFIIAFILYAVKVSQYHKARAIAEACGELPSPRKQSIVECPKKECVEKKVVDCATGNPCDKKTKVESTVIEKKVLSTTGGGQRITHEYGDPTFGTTTKVVTVVPAQPATLAVDQLYPSNVPTTTTDAFAAANLKPLTSLAPS
jgi:hypothetical protein